MFRTLILRISTDFTDFLYYQLYPRNPCKSVLSVFNFHTLLNNVQFIFFLPPRRFNALNSSHRLSHPFLINNNSLCNSYAYLFLASKVSRNAKILHGIIHMNHSHDFSRQNCYTCYVTNNLYELLKRALPCYTIYIVSHGWEASKFNGKSAPKFANHQNYVILTHKKAPKMGVKLSHVTQCILCNIKSWLLQNTSTQSHASFNSAYLSNQRECSAKCLAQIITNQNILSTKFCGLPTTSTSKVSAKHYVCYNYFLI